MIIYISLRRCIEEDMVKVYLMPDLRDDNYMPVNVLPSMPMDKARFRCIGAKTIRGANGSAGKWI